MVCFKSIPRQPLWGLFVHIAVSDTLLIRCISNISFDYSRRIQLRSTILNINTLDCCVFDGVYRQMENDRRSDSFLECWERARERGTRVLPHHQSESFLYCIIFFKGRNMWFSIFWLYKCMLIPCMLSMVSHVFSPCDYVYRIATEASFFTIYTHKSVTFKPNEKLWNSHDITFVCYVLNIVTTLFQVNTISMYAIMELWEARSYHILTLWKMTPSFIPEHLPSENYLKKLSTWNIRVQTSLCLVKWFLIEITFKYLLQKRHFVLHKNKKCFYQSTFSGIFD